MTSLPVWFAEPGDRMDGIEITSVALQSVQLITVTLADGTVRLFLRMSGDALAAGHLQSADAVTVERGIE